MTRRGTLAVLTLLFLTACAPDDHDPGGTQDDSAPNAEARGGPDVWVLGSAIRDEGTTGFLLRRVVGQWTYTPLDLPFAESVVEAIAAPASDDPWLAGEGTDDPETEPFAPFLYRVTASGLVPLTPPPLPVAVTRICPLDGSAWIVGARRVGSTLAGYAAIGDGTDWTAITPSVPPTVVRWNLADADFASLDVGAAIGLVSDNQTGSGILGAVFLLDPGGWRSVPLPFDPETDVYIFTEVRQAGGAVRVVGRANLAGWIAHLDPATEDWTVEDLSAFAGLSPMWELSSVVDDGRGVRWALGSMDVTGYEAPLVLRDAGDGWTRVDLPAVPPRNDRHQQLRDGVLLSPSVGFATVSRYLYDGTPIDEDFLIAWDGSAWAPVPLSLPEPRVRFRAILRVPVR